MEIDLNIIGIISSVIAAVTSFVMLLYTLIKDYRKKPKIKITGFQIWYPQKNKNKIGKIIVEVVNTGGDFLRGCRAYLLVNNKHYYRLYSWDDFKRRGIRTDSDIALLKPFEIFDIPPNTKKELVVFIKKPVSINAHIKVVFEYGSSKVEKVIKESKHIFLSEIREW